MKRALIIAVACFSPLLTAAMCTTTKDVEPATTTVFAKPVPTDCNPDIKPPSPLPTATVPLDGSIKVLGDAFAGDRSILIIDNIGLRAALKGCKGPEAAAARLVTPVTP